MTLDFAFTNLTSNPFSDLQLFDYFNFHPEGSANLPSRYCGVTEYDGAIGGIVTTDSSGPGCTNHLANGEVYGSQMDAAHEVGYAAGGSPIVWSDISNLTPLNGSVGPVGPGDTAGALRWDLGDLSSQLHITVYKNLADVVPEPGTWYLGLGSGAVLLGLLRRRKA